MFGIFSLFTRFKSLKQFSHISENGNFSSMNIPELVFPTAAKCNKNFESLELLELGLFLLNAMSFTRDEISASNAEVYELSVLPRSSKISALFLCVYVAPVRSPLEKLFLATSVMRLHRKIFHDTKTLLSKTFFSISTQPLFPPPHWPFLYQIKN